MFKAFTFATFTEFIAFDLTTAVPFGNASVAVAVIHYDIGIDHKIGVFSEFKLMNDDIILKPMESVEKNGATELQIELELFFTDSKAVNTVFRLVEGKVEENFDDMRVRSVIDSAQSTRIVENHFRTPPRVILMIIAVKIGVWKA